MVYELINMSDDVAFEAPDFPTAAAVTILLGHGQYGATPLGEGPAVPLMLFGLPDGFAEDYFGGDLSGWAEAHRGQVAEALETAYYGSPAEWEETREMRRELLDKRNDRRRSSINDIVSRAKRIAAQLRKKEQPEDASRQVAVL